MGDCVAGPPSTVLWQASGPPLLHQLPEDVLRHIASKVSTRYEVSASSLCSSQAPVHRLTTCGAPSNVHMLSIPLCCREWAQIAPTCTVLQRLQPTSLTVATSPWIMNRGVPGHVPSVFLWTSRHLKVCQCLHQPPNTCKILSLFYARIFAVHCC